MERYSRQLLVPGVGKSGQEKLLRSKAVVIGCGALGTVIANNLVRAGVGYVRVVDRDYVELDNLQRQILFDEDDVEKGRPKALAAADKLRKINSSVTVDAEVKDVNRKNIEELIKGMDVVLDGTDNFETRFLINDACFKHETPWIYGAVLSSYGMTMSFIPGVTPCFRCVVSPLPPPGSTQTCDTVGVLNGVSSCIGSIQSTEAVRILLGDKSSDQSLLIIDLMKRSFEKLPVKRRGDCPTCVAGQFEYLDRKGPLEPIELCGREMMQFTPPQKMEVSLEFLKEKLAKLGDVSYVGSLLQFKIGNYELIVFPDGRAFIKGTTDKKLARSLYTRYIGL